MKMQSKSGKKMKLKRTASREGAEKLSPSLSLGILVGMGLLGLLLSSTPAFASGKAFPKIEATSDKEEILSQYPAYLHFAVEVGKDVDRNNTARMTKLYSALLKRNPNSAALFLKGLRFEMVEKVELMGRGTNEISTHTPEIRRWVARYMKEWAREADEHLFRAVSAPRSELARME